MRISRLRSSSVASLFCLPMLASIGCGASNDAPAPGGSGGRALSGNGGATLSSGGFLSQGGRLGSGGVFGAGGNAIQGGAPQGGSATQSGAGQAGSAQSGATQAGAAGMTQVPSGGQSGASQGGSAQGGAGPQGGGSAQAGSAGAAGNTAAAGSAGASGSPGVGGTTGLGGSAGGNARGGSAGSGSGGTPGTGGATTGTGGATTGTGGSASCTPAPITDEVFGWAAVSGDGVATTTGGLGGATVTATSADQLKTYASSADPLIIRIQGAMAVGTMNIASNKTLIGVGPNTILSGSLRVRPASSSDPVVTNVIIRNLKVDATTALPDDGGDGIHIERAHHVWIDHCEVWNAPDGNTDITHGSNWITISWTKYRYTSAAPDPAHRFSNLIGHSENAAATDRGRLKVTFHHNWWAEQIEQRMPRVRFGQIHVYNNYFTAAGNTATIAAGTEAQIVVENNHFEGVYDAHFFHEGSTTAQIVATGNAYVNTTGKRDVGQGSAFTPPYPYSMDAVANVPCIVQQGAGPH